jgi:glycerophosphoryl diester phosphodiesterase
VALLFAHRGASAELPENTLPAFHRALEVGAGALETDAHLTRDGHVVLSHDPGGARCAGVPRPIRASTLAEVRSWDMGCVFRRSHRVPATRFVMPTLDELLAELPGVPVNVDVKDHDAHAARAVVDVVRRRKAEDRVTLASFDAATLRVVRRLGYEGATSTGSSEVLRLILLPERALRRFPLAARAAQLPLRVGPFSLDTPAFVAKVHALGMALHYWTIDDPAEATRLLALGADGIMTNDPARIAPVFARATPASGSRC